MNALNIKIAGLAFAAALATTSATLLATGAPAAAATPIVVEAALAHSARVAHADLNLRSPAGVQRLDARVRNAAEKLCTDPNVRSLEVFIAGKNCVRVSVERAQPQIARAIDRQRHHPGGGGQQMIKS
jgi:UrcA family protein